MQRLYRTVVQLEESKRFILNGGVAHLRLALILLDNAVEAIMNRVIDDKLENARMYARMLDTFPSGGLDAKGEALRREIASRVIPTSRQKKIEHSFGEKVVFLSDDCDCLPSAAARALRRLHQYRNETQHRDRIRVGSIRPAVLVLFDIAADLLVNLPSGTVWASDDDYGWLRRYGLSGRLSDAFAAGVDDLRARIAAQLRSGLPLEVGGVRTALVAHLTDRLDAMNEDLAFVATNWTIGPELSRTLRAIQFLYDRQPDCHVDDPELQAFVPNHDLDSFTQWRSAVAELNSVEDRLVMFGQFATIEEGFEPLETMVKDMASTVDGRIQAEIDRMRGK